MSGDWIKLHRQALDSRVFSSAAIWQLWCYLLLKANWKETYYELERIGPGELIFGRNAAANDLKCPASTIYRNMKKLEDMGMIELKPNNKWTTVSICNWETYQNTKKQSEHQMDIQRTSSGHQVDIEWTHHKKAKNLKESKESKEGGAAHATLPHQEIVDKWNSIDGITACRKLTSKRCKALRSRLSDPDWRRDWREGIERISRSEFCRGQNDRGWKADIDWFLRPDTLTKILEGKYDEHKPQPFSGLREFAEDDSIE